jgi:hypothetical protein
VQTQMDLARFSCLAGLKKRGNRIEVLFHHSLQTTLDFQQSIYELGKSKTSLPIVPRMMLKKRVMT